MEPSSITSPGTEAMILAPWSHAAAVQAFDRAFGIPAGTPTQELLHRILDGFSRMPYENISKIIKYCRLGDDPTRIRTPAEVIEDHLRMRLGGTCFSLTFCLQCILTHHDYDCYPVMAHMRAGENIHCALVVRMDGAMYLVDPGYLLNRPMEINLEKPRLYRTEFAGVELRRDEASQSYDLFTFNRSEVKWRYRFADVPTPPEEFAAHWQVSFSKNSMHGICLTRSTETGLLYIHKTFMRETTFEGKRNFNIKHNYHQAIRDTFGIEAEVVEQAQAALAENLARERALGIYRGKK